jgi:acetyltransferase EpsM
VVKLVVVGAGGHGAEIVSYIEALLPAGDVELIGLVDDGRPAGPFEGSAIVGDLKALATLMDTPGGPTHYITAVGNNRVREELVARIHDISGGRLQPWTLRHPLAVAGASARVGAGVCLAPTSILTTRLSIGDHAIVNVKASVSHDCEVGDFVNLNPGVTICGNVRIGRGCYIGAGATVIDKISIGDWAVIGAGAVVIEDIPPGVTAVGVPARIVRRSSPASRP